MCLELDFTYAMQISLWSVNLHIENIHENYNRNYLEK